jgi:heme/copper-type cytochrome/quinol oxidase subunit 4
MMGYPFIVKAQGLVSSLGCAIVIQNVQWTIHILYYLHVNTKMGHILIN